MFVFFQDQAWFAEGQGVCIPKSCSKSDAEKLIKQGEGRVAIQDRMTLVREAICFVLFCLCLVYSDYTDGFEFKMNCVESVRLQLDGAAIFTVWVEQVDPLYMKGRVNRCTTS